MFLLLILMIGAVSASEDFTQDNLTVQTDESDVLDMPISQDEQPNGENDVLGQVVTSYDDNQNGSAQSGEPVLSSMGEDDIKIKVNSKTIDTTNENTVIVTYKIPKGEKGTAMIDFEDRENFLIKLSKLPKKTKNGFTTYYLRLKDMKGYDLMEDLKNNQVLGVGLKYNHIYDGSTTACLNYIVKINKKAKTLILKNKIPTQIWIGNYDRKSGTNKILKVHLGIPTNKKPLCDSKSKHIAGKKVKITINGVVYYKKTNSKGLVYIYPPKYLPPKDYTKVKMEFAGDSKYWDCMGINDIQIYKNPGSSKSKIKASAKTFSVNKTKKYTVNLISKGKAVKKAKLKLVINGKKFSAKTNSKGKATFNLAKLTKHGKFKATVLYMGDKKHYMAYKNVKLTFK